MLPEKCFLGKAEIMKRNLSLLVLLLGTSTIACSQHPFDSAEYTELTYEQQFFCGDPSSETELMRVDLTREGAELAMVAELEIPVAGDCPDGCAPERETVERQLSAADVTTLHTALDEATLKPDDNVCPAILHCTGETITVDGESFTTGCGTDKLEGADMRRIADALSALAMPAMPE